MWTNAVVDPHWEYVRTLTLFWAGLGGVFYEMLYVRPPDTEMLVIFGAMMGLPLFLKRNGGGK